VTITQVIVGPTRKMMKATKNNVEEGLAELSGVRLCAGPNCQIILKEGQGKRTEIGTYRILTCFQTRCVDWASAQVAS
jgi:hypothetical protein